MGVYYLSACNDCKERVMWPKTSEDQALKWHSEFHKEHNTVFGNDYDEDFYDSIWKYKDIKVD